MNIIRKTESVCPRCFLPLEALIIEEDNKILFRKKCPVHGVCQIILSEHPWYYRQSSRFFFSVMNSDLPADSFHLYVTDKCNLSCRICITESGHSISMGDLNKGNVEKIIKGRKRVRFIIFGGEPTCNEDLTGIIKLMKEHGHTVMMCTNGVKLADPGYLSKLVRAGLDRVDLQFDGFNDKVYNVIRERGLLKIKLKALNNLKELNVPTGLSMLVIKGLNQDQIDYLLDYAVKNSFIKNISFIALAFMGGAYTWPLDKYIVPDQIVDLLEERTEGKINRKNLFFYQKVFNAYSSFIKKRRCFYYQSYSLVRKPGGYTCIDEIFEFKKMDYELEMYAKHLNRNRFLAFLYLLKGFVKVSVYAVFKPMGLGLLFEIFKTAFYYALPGGNYNKNSRLLNIIFTTACDPYKMDKTAGKYCHRGIFYKQNGEIRRFDFRFDYNFAFQEAVEEK